MPPRIPRKARSRVFGRDPAAYDRARLGYPSRVYEILTTRCGLHRGSTIFEIGPGTGIATRELLRLGAGPITLVEPDRRLAQYLANSLGTRDASVRFTVRRFEDAKLPKGAFDLGVAASSFHWTPQRLALRKVARALRLGGWWAYWNNQHGDPERPGGFRRALQPLYRTLSGGRPSKGYSRTDLARECRNRLAALRSVGTFDRVACENIRWSVTLETLRVQALWASFSETVVLTPSKRRWFLTELGRIVDERFGGTVEIPMVTPIFTARRI